MSGLLFASCLDDDDDGGICLEAVACSTNQPTHAILGFELSEHFEELEVRQGRTFETGTLVWRGSEPRGLTLPLGWYSAQARYVHQGDTVIAVDGGELGYSESENCGATCYEAEDVTLDLALSPGVWENR
jgi:hypothetical protein